MKKILSHNQILNKRTYLKSQRASENRYIKLIALVTALAFILSLLLPTLFT